MLADYFKIERSGFGSRRDGEERSKEPSLVTLHVETNAFEDGVKLVETFEILQEVKFAVQKEGGKPTVCIIPENGQELMIPTNSVWEGE